MFSSPSHSHSLLTTAEYASDLLQLQQSMYLGSMGNRYLLTTAEYGSDLLQLQPSIPGIGKHVLQLLIFIMTRTMIDLRCFDGV
jgi:hypothetical protein